ncbi:MAG: polymer-forming cytoskeletal protein [Candidatus Humimicrobiaceae bacterium]
MAFQSKEDVERNDYQNTGESRTLLTISGDAAEIEGKFTISESIEIDCKTSGELEIDGELIIQKNGYVNADVKTNNATVIGKYEGNMEATGNVEIKETGEVNGNVKTDSLIINKGGVFSGNVTRINVEKQEEEERIEEVAGSNLSEEEEEVDLEDAGDKDRDLEL